MKNDSQNSLISFNSYHKDTENQGVKQLYDIRIIHPDKESSLTGSFEKNNSKERLIKAALQYAYLGFSVIPTKNDNTPAIQLDNYQSRIMDDYMIRTYFSWKSVTGVAIICGEVSGSLEVIDIDCKNDETGTLEKSLFDLIRVKLPDIYNKLVIAKAINNVWHIFYRCEKIDGEEKLSSNKNKQIIIETQGEGDYIIVAPSPGFEFIKGDLSKISVITPDERDLLFSTVRSLDQLGSLEVIEKEITKNDDVLSIQKIEALSKEKGKQDEIHSITAGEDKEASSEHYETEDQSTATISTPILPIDGFPEFVQEFIRTCSAIYRTPQDFWAGAAISAIALAIGDKLELITKYRNVPVFWICIVGDVSSGKTEVLNICLSPFKDMDNLSIARYNEDTAEYERLMRLTRIERRSEGMENPTKPQCFQYILNDFTPEALVDVHAVNSRGLIIERDELKGWLDDFNRYNKSGEQSNMLSTWSLMPVTYNRNSSGVLHISKPVISVIGGMQPSILPCIAADHRDENGFLSRMCFVYPDNTDKPEYFDESVPSRLIDGWDRFIRDLAGVKQTSELKLSEMASLVYEEWYNRNAKMTNDEPSGYLKGVYGKLDIIALRLAIVLKGAHMVLGGDQSVYISAEIMDAAIYITEYFRATALKVYHKLFTNISSELNKSDIIKWVTQNLPERSVSEIARFLKTNRTQIGRIKKKGMR
jgi:hypothetical protein